MVTANYCFASYRKTVDIYSSSLKIFFAFQIFLLLFTPTMKQSSTYNFFYFFYYYFTKSSQVVFAKA